MPDAAIIYAAATPPLHAAYADFHFRFATRAADTPLSSRHATPLYFDER